MRALLNRSKLLGFGSVFAVALLLPAVVGRVLQAQGPVSPLAPTASLPVPGGISETPGSLNPVAVPSRDLLPSSKPMPLSGSSPHAAVDGCVDYITNSGLDYLDDWVVLVENVYYTDQAYTSEPHSAVMVDGDDTTVGGYDFSPYEDALGQGFDFPSQNVTSLRIDFWAAFVDSDDWDDLYYSLYTLDAGGFLDQEVAKWTVNDPEDEQWYPYDVEVTDSTTIAALSGQWVALVFRTETDGAAPFEVVYLDDVYLEVCTGAAPTATTPPTATPTTPPGQTPTPTPTQPTGALVQNGDFETGDFSGWYTEGGVAIDTGQPDGGLYVARFGGANDAADQIYQVVTIPADADQVTLRMWQRIDTQETWMGYDYYCIRFWDDQGQGVVVDVGCYDAGQGSADWFETAYAFSAAELAQFRGQSLILQIFLVTDWSLPTTAWVDDVSLSVGGGAIPPTPVPTPTATTAPQADLSPSTLVADKSVVQPGETIDYTIVLKNQGSAAAPAASIQNTLPDATTFDSWISAGGATQAGNTITWSGSVGGGSQHTVAFRVRVSASASDGTNLVDSLTINDGQGHTYTRQATTLVSSQTEKQTLILTHGGRLETLYGAPARNNVINGINNKLVPHAQVQGVFVDLASESSVTSAYNAWINNQSNANANAVTVAVRGVIESNLNAYPTIEYVVLVGNDLVIPFRRVRDGTELEGYYPYDIAGDPNRVENVTERALNDNYVLTDDYYVDRQFQTPPGWDHALHLPDLPIGRLIETPAEIIATIDTFSGGASYSLDQGVITGQAVGQQGQRMGDGTAREICRLLRQAGTTCDCAEIATKSEPDAATINKVLGSRRDVRVMIEHANHYNVGIDARDDVATASGANLIRSFFYSVGCHGGLNVPDTDSPGPRPLDLAQAFSQKGAAYFSNTGYGLGSGSSQIALTERLLVCLTEQLTSASSTTIGKAIAAAKQDYWARWASRSRYQPDDEKILLQAVLYGLPMTRVTRPGVTVQSPPVGATASPGLQAQTFTSVSSSGLTKQRTTFYDYTLALTDTVRGSYYYYLDPISGTLTTPGWPVQPKIYTQFYVRGTNVHGVAFYGGKYTDHSDFTPLVPQLSIPALNLAEEERLQTVPYAKMNWYPAVPHMFAEAQSYSPETLVVALGLYHQGLHTARLYDEITFNVYYSTSDDVTSPTISSVGTAVEQAVAKITVRAADGESGIEELLITYTDGGGTWSSISLKQEGSGDWTGSLPAAAGLDYVVQVVDRAGNVALDDNSGNYYLINGGTGGSRWQLYLPLVVRGT